MKKHNHSIDIADLSKQNITSELERVYLKAIKIIEKEIDKYSSITRDPAETEIRKFHDAVKLLGHINSFSLKKEYVEYEMKLRKAEQRDL